MWLHHFLVTAVAVHVVVCENDCMIDSTKGWYDPENVYQCPNGKTCCHEENKPSCCASKKIEQEVIDQAILWGSVIGATIGVAILIYCCCHRDSGCCSEEKTCKYYFTCGCCRNSEKPIPYEKFPPPSPTASIHSIVKEKSATLPIGHDGEYKKITPPSPGEMKSSTLLQADKLLAQLT